MDLGLGLGVGLGRERRKTGEAGPVACVSGQGRVNRFSLGVNTLGNYFLAGVDFPFLAEDFSALGGC